MSENVTREDLVVTRIFDAPLELVWKAWTDPDEVKRWWGPQYFTSPSCSIDLREGGKYVFAMRAPAEQGGGVSYTSGVYQRIVPMERLEFTQGLSDQDGNRLDPAEMGMPADFPKELHTVVTFKALGEMTELTIRQAGWTMGQMYVYALAGTHQQFDKLSAAVARKR